jgi:hypothetical protein
MRARARALECGSHLGRGFGKGRCARARGSDRRFRRFKNCSASHSHAVIPPTKLLPPVAVLRGGLGFLSNFYIFLVIDIKNIKK